MSCSENTLLYPILVDCRVYMSFLVFTDQWLVISLENGCERFVNCEFQV